MFRGRCDGQKCVLKRFTSEDSRGIRELLTETYYLHRLRGVHKNVIRYMGYNVPTLCLVLPRYHESLVRANTGWVVRSTNPHPARTVG